MKKRSRRFRSLPSRNKTSAKQQEQTQKDVEAFREWIASGEANKPVTLDELQGMLVLASKIK